MHILPLDLITWTGNTGPAFVAALAAFVSACGLLIRARTASRALSVKLERIESLSKEAVTQTNGRLSELMESNRQLRDELDATRTQLSHSRRTVELLLEKRLGNEHS